MHAIGSCTVGNDIDPVHRNFKFLRQVARVARLQNETASEKFYIRGPQIWSAANGGLRDGGLRKSEDI